jgi:ectoine hydroxylase-related dioxygenase (phytanoyl-CoA dioxygenase family)
VVNDTDWTFFDKNGFILLKGVLQGDDLKQMQTAFDAVWENEGPGVNQHKLLKYRAFIDLIEHPAILDQHTAVFGSQVQLLQYDLLRQGPNNDGPERSWHRDFAFPGDYPLSINTIVYLDEMTDMRGPTYALPGSHRGWKHPPTGEDRSKPIAGEYAAHAEPGDALFINSAVWHSGGINRTTEQRRGIFLYYGHWWLKRFEWDQDIPWQALEEADERRLSLLGFKQQQGDLHIYQPDALRNRDRI